MPDLKPYEQLTEDGIKHAIIEARGDIFVAAQFLGVTAMRMDRGIRSSTILQETLKQVRLPENAALDSAALEEAIRARTQIYRVVGLDSLHELATMPLSENSAQNQVKLAAAARLAGSSESSGAGGEVAETLRALNESYQKEAPRIRVIRERTTVEVDPGRVVSSD